MAKKLSIATKLTNEYVRLSARQEAIARRMAEIKQAIIAEHPEGVKTPHGAWQVFADGTRLTYETKNIQGIIDNLILEGNSHIAERLLKIRKESTTNGGVRFIKAKE
jgi:hypothetical protein